MSFSGPDSLPRFRGRVARGVYLCLLDGCLRVDEVIGSRRGATFCSACDTLGEGGNLSF